MYRNSIRRPAHQRHRLAQRPHPQVRGPASRPEIVHHPAPPLRSLPQPAQHRRQAQHSHYDPQHRARPHCHRVHRHCHHSVRRPHLRDHDPESRRALVLRQASPSRSANRRRQAQHSHDDPQRRARWHCRRVHRHCHRSVRRPHLRDHDLESRRAIVRRRAPPSRHFPAPAKHQHPTRHLRHDREHRVSRNCRRARCRDQLHWDRLRHRAQHSRQRHHSACRPQDSRQRPHHSAHRRARLRLHRDLRRGARADRARSYPALRDRAPVASRPVAAGRVRRHCPVPRVRRPRAAMRRADARFHPTRAARSGAHAHPLARVHSVDRSDWRSDPHECARQARCAHRLRTLASVPDRTAGRRCLAPLTAHSRDHQAARAQPARATAVAPVAPVAPAAAARAVAPAPVVPARVVQQPLIARVAR